MKIKDYIELYKKDFNLFKLESSFDILDKLILELKKIKKSESSKKTIEVLDYNTDEVFYVDAIEAQNLFDNFYHDQYYIYFLEKYVWCKNLLSKINNRIKESDSNIDDLFLAEISLLYFKIVLFSLRTFAKINSYEISYNLLLNELKRNFYSHLKFEEKLLNTVSSEVLDGLIEDGFMKKKGNMLVISDDSIRLDLLVKSFIPVKIYSFDSEISYGCYYGLSTLYFVIYKYLATKNQSYNEYLINKYSYDTEKYLILENNLEDYRHLELSSFLIFQENKYDYGLLSRILVDKLILNEYWFQTLLLCCFKKYYFSDRFNILHQRSYELGIRLVP